MTKHTVVITGGTRGIGFGLATRFLRGGHDVCITGRSQASVDKALQNLQQDRGNAKLVGIPCDVSKLDAVQNAWDFASHELGGVDIWINNAGVANRVEDFEQLGEGEYTNVIETNVIGVMHCCKVAILGMKAQGHGQVYNMEGFGSDGRIAPGLSAYGTSKRAVTYFTDALIKENADTAVNIGFLSPGIVITDMIMKEAQEMSPERWERTRRIYNILGDNVDTVTTWLTEQTLSDYGKHGSRLAWLTGGKAAARFFSAFVLRQKRDVVGEDLP